MDCCGAPIPSLRELLAELRQAEQEFGQLNYDRRSKVLTVMTDPIELEDVYLGEFEIQLPITSLSEAHTDEMYRVVAVDPHPAASDEAVTHPHVRDECLCPGDARAALRSALYGGRICDFFLLVKSVLTEYNAGSPYVSLEKWYGIPCYECGNRTNNEDLYRCCDCESDFCEDCICRCERCDTVFCPGCSQECRVCGDPVCSACLTRCPHCKRKLCQTCLDEELCTGNQEKEKQGDFHKPTTTGQDDRNTVRQGAGTEAA